MTIRKQELTIFYFFRGNGKSTLHDQRPQRLVAGKLTILDLKVENKKFWERIGKIL